MSLLAAACNGKRVDYTRSNSYKTRAICTGIKINSDPSWVLSPYKRLHKKSPGRVFQDHDQPDEHYGAVEDDS